MKYIYNKDTYLTEQALITKKGTKLLADDILLKNVNISNITKNIACVNFGDNNFFKKNKFFCYFFDSHEFPPKLGKEVELLLFPYRIGNIGDRSRPIDDIWKKSYLKPYKGSEHILGIVEGTADENEILIEMMSVRPGYKRNRINSLMIDELRNKYPNAKLIFEDPTEDGVDFIRKYSPDAEIIWLNNRRPKNWNK